MGEEWGVMLVCSMCMEIADVCRNILNVINNICQETSLLY